MYEQEVTMTWFLEVVGFMLVYAAAAVWVIQMPKRAVTNESESAKRE